MSSIASATILPASRTKDILKAAVPKKKLFGGVRDDFREVLARVGTELPDYDGDGYTLAVLLPYLDEQGLDFVTDVSNGFASELCAARESTFIVLNPEHREAHLERLSALHCEPAELARYYEEFTGADAPGSAEAMHSGIEYLKHVLSALEDGHVALIEIG